MQSNEQNFLISLFGADPDINEPIESDEAVRMLTSYTLDTMAGGGSNNNQINPIFADIMLQNDTAPAMFSNSSTVGDSSNAIGVPAAQSTAIGAVPALPQQAQLVTTTTGLESQEPADGARHQM